MFGAIAGGSVSSLDRCVFFFFQAEDGIRDDLVTGVQTCALPISAGPHSDQFPQVGASGDLQFSRLSRNGAFALPRSFVGSQNRNWGEAFLDLLSFRSEERRVGKECRSRWSPYH